MLWTDKEEALLIRKYPWEDRREVMAALPDRTWRAIGNHASKLGIERLRLMGTQITHRREIAGKICTGGCKVWKPLTEYSLDRRRRGGRSSQCKACHNEYNARRYISDPAHRKAVNERNRRWQQENPGREAERRVRRHAENPERSREYATSRRALKAGAEGSHTRVEFMALCEATGQVCLCCGTPHSESPLTEDHIIPLSMGGSDDISNIQPLCLHCNDSKGVKTIDYRQNSGMVVVPNF